MCPPAHYDQKKNGLRQMIHEKSNPQPPVLPGRIQPTLQGIADQSGLSVTTISRVLSGQASRYRISKETEVTVRKLAKDSSFVANQLARGLRLKKTLTIGLVIPDISNPFYAGIAHQVIVGTRKYGYSVILCDSQDDTGLEVQSLALLQSRGVEGVVLCPTGRSIQHLAPFVGGRLPIVLVDRFFPDLPLPYVSSDNVAGARQATELLITSGHRRIACLQGLRGTSPSEFRVRGYKEALAHHHLPIENNLIVGGQFHRAERLHRDQASPANRAGREGDFGPQPLERLGRDPCPHRRKAPDSRRRLHHLVRRHALFLLPRHAVDCRGAGQLGNGRGRRQAALRPDPVASPANQGWHPASHDFGDARIGEASGITHSLKAPIQLNN